MQEWRASVIPAHSVPFYTVQNFQARCKTPKEILRIGLVVIALFGNSHCHRFISGIVKRVVDAFAGLQWADEWNEQYSYSHVQTIQK